MKPIKPPKPKLGPRKAVARKPSGVQQEIQQTEYQISFDPLAFDRFINSQGIWVTHYIAIPDPRGMSSRGDNRDVLALRPKDSDGFIYKEVGELQVLFTSNSKYVDQKDLGELSFASAYMTMPRFYPITEANKEKKIAGKPVVLDTWDKFYLKDISVKVSDKQFLEASRGGEDRLAYPAVAIQVLVDSNGVYYEENVDFRITETGNIRWLGVRRPGWDPTTGRGTVYSIKYEYTPFFIVARLMHEIRVAQITNQATFERTLERMPYQIQVMRETVFRNNDNPSDSDKKLPANQYAPAVGGNLGPVGPKVGGRLGPLTKDGN